MTIDALDFIAKVGGVGGVMALLMFLSYRYLVQQVVRDRQHSEERLTGVLKDYNEVCRMQATATVDSTKVQAELFTWLREHNGHRVKD